MDWRRWPALQVAGRPQCPQQPRRHGREKLMLRWHERSVQQSAVLHQCGMCALTRLTGLHA
eukprot:9336312-Alexandrium_andersonii.AAC.1